MGSMFKMFGEFLRKSTPGSKAESGKRAIAKQPESNAQIATPPETLNSDETEKENETDCNTDKNASDTAAATSWRNTGFKSKSDSLITCKLRGIHSAVGAGDSIGLHEEKSDEGAARQAEEARRDLMSAATQTFKGRMVCFLHAIGDERVASIPVDICAGVLSKPVNLLNYSGLFITNLNWDVSNEKLCEMLSPFGSIIKMTLVRRTMANVRAGKCILVAFEKAESATRALHAHIGCDAIFDPTVTFERMRPMGVQYSAGWNEKKEEKMMLHGRELEQRITTAGECPDWRIFGFCRNRSMPGCALTHYSLARGVDRVPIRMLER